PSRLAVLAARVQSANVRAPSFSMPPPRKAELPDRVQLVRASVAVLKMPPPAARAAAWPLAMVSPERLTETSRIAPAGRSTVQTRKAGVPAAGLRCTVRAAAGPRTRVLRKRLGRALCRAMEPRTAKVTSLPPARAAAARALRSEPGPASAVVVTT